MSNVNERILLIDDDAMVLRVCAEVLYREGHEVVAVGTGQEGLQLLSQQQFAAAVVDIVLPDIDGLTILKTIRDTDPDLVVLLITGYARLETAIDAVRYGAYDYLRKPFSNEDLVCVVERGLEQRRQAIQDRRRLAELADVNQQLTQKVEHADEELTAFIKLGGPCDQSQTLVRMLEHVIRAAAQLTGATHGGVFHQQPDGRIICQAAEGPRAAELSRTELSREPLVQQALQSERPVIRQRLLDDPAVATGPLALAGFNSAMIVPLLGSAGPAGALVMLDADKEFTERQASLVKVMAGQAAGILSSTTPTKAADQPQRAADEFVDLQDLLDRSI